MSGKKFFVYIENTFCCDNMIFNNISKYRSSLMGIAMLSVFLFHSMGDWMPPFIHNIAANGAVGVDVFLFLSAMGLTYSITKNPSVMAFYKRRVWRIMPTYWLVMSCVYLFVFALMVVHIMPESYYPIPRNGWQIVQAYTTLGYWMKDGIYYLWYIPAILLLYLLFPFIHKIFMVSKWTYVLAFVPAIVIAFAHPNIAWYHNCLLYRVGIFLWGGIFTIEFLQKNREIKSSWVFLTGGVALLFYLVRMELDMGMFNRLLEEPLFFVTLPCILVCMTWWCKYRIFEMSTAFVGKISLEFYLIHEFVMRFMETISNVIITMSPMLQKMMTLVVSLVLAYCVHRLVPIILGMFNKKCIRHKANDSVS